MRKRNVNFLFDNILWYLVYLLPLICFVVMLIVNGSPLTLSGAMTSCGLGILADNVVFVSLNSLFGVGGVLPFFVSTDILLYFSWFICTMIAHLAVDVLLFLVRYAHHLMDCFGGDKN